MDEAEIERDARIIDPASWRCLDALILGLTTGAACDTVAMSRAVREGVTDAASLKAWWLNPDDLDTWAEKGCRSSLRKAAEINTARSEGRKAADTALSERVAELEKGLEEIAREGENGLDMWGCRFAARALLHPSEGEAGT